MKNVVDFSRHYMEKLISKIKGRPVLSVTGKFDRKTAEDFASYYNRMLSENKKKAK